MPRWNLPDVLRLGYFSEGKGALDWHFLLFPRNPQGRGAGGGGASASERCHPTGPSACSPTVRQSRFSDLLCAVCPAGHQGLRGHRTQGHSAKRGRSAVTVFQNKRGLSEQPRASRPHPHPESRFFRSHSVPAGAPKAVPALLFFLEMEQLFTAPALENTWKREFQQVSRLLPPTLQPSQAGP